jgi:hypothetical protein
MLVPPSSQDRERAATLKIVAVITYFHVELAKHEIILAEGLPCESYLDTGDRFSFADQDAVALHPSWGSEARDVTLVMEASSY